MHELSCTCACGKVTVAVSSAPFARFICHCTICQSFYKAPFSDATVLWASGTRLNAPQNVLFKKHRGPPALSRGVCVSCGRPVIAYMSVASSPQLAFVPASNYPDSYKLPPPAIHIFYRSRIADALDNLPKYSGYWRSQWAAAQLIAHSAFRRSTEAPM